jgi:hypothetical protein
MASAHRASGGLRREHSRSPVSVVYEDEFKGSSMGLQRTLADASGRSMTEPKRFIRKRPLTSGRWTPSCQGGCRGFDPRFPLQRRYARSAWILPLRAHPLQGFAPRAPRCAHTYLAPQRGRAVSRTGRPILLGQRPRSRIRRAIQTSEEPCREQLKSAVRCLGRRRSCVSWLPSGAVSPDGKDERHSRYCEG